MQKCILCVGAPASGKSTWAKEEVRKAPEKVVRVNRDELRIMMNNYHHSNDNESLVTSTKDHIIRTSLKKGRDVIIDETNVNRRNFEDVCKMVRALNIDCTVMEKAFYVDLEEAVARDNQREGHAKVGEEVIKKFWKKLGGTQHKHYKPRVEIITANSPTMGLAVDGPPIVKGAPTALIVDLDGTLALVGDRSPYNAKDCDIIDLPNIPVIETVLAHYAVGRKIIFCSGREDKFEPETRRFIEKYCVTDNPNLAKETTLVKPIEYKLFMRQTNDFRKDAIVKEEIYRREIEGKYNVLCVLDDRRQVVEFWRSKGLTCFQVAPGEF